MHNFTFTYIELHLPFSSSHSFQRPWSFVQDLRCDEIHGWWWWW